MNRAEADRARRDARIDLLPADPMHWETVAYDVAVIAPAPRRRGDDIRLIGRWSQREGSGGAITWLPKGDEFETGDCDLDTEKIAAAIRATIPLPADDSHRRGATHLLRRLGTFGQR